MKLAGSTCCPQSTCVERYERREVSERIWGPMIEDRAVVAIIDCDQSSRHRLRDVLEAAGLTVELFESVENYLRRGTPRAFNCTVLEVQLPGINGLDLQSRLAKLRLATPLVFLAADEDVRASVQAMKAGAIDFLTRPFKEEELLAAVRNGVNRDRAHRAAHQKLVVLQTRLASLSRREREIMVRLLKGQKLKQMAGEMGICTSTARVHSSRVLSKMGARSIVDLVRMADRLMFKEGATSPGSEQTVCRQAARSSTPDQARMHFDD